MKAIALIVLSGLVVVAGWLTWPTRKQEPATPPVEPTIEHLAALPHGKVLYVVVDYDGAYLDTQRIEFAHARHVVSTMLREQKIRNLIIYGTDRARYGDVVEIYAGIQADLLRYSSFSFRALPTGSRKPMTGYLKPQCCHSIDIENASPDEK